jgi:hypothetical protein
VCCMQTALRHRRGDRRNWSEQHTALVMGQCLGKPPGGMGVSGQKPYQQNGGYQQNGYNQYQQGDAENHAVYTVLLFSRECSGPIQGFR